MPWKPLKKRIADSTKRQYSDPQRFSEALQSQGMNAGDLNRFLGNMSSEEKKERPFASAVYYYPSEKDRERGSDTAKVSRHFTSKRGTDYWTGDKSNIVERDLEDITGKVSKRADAKFMSQALRNPEILQYFTDLNSQKQGFLKREDPLRKRWFTPK